MFQNKKKRAQNDFRDFIVFYAVVVNFINFIMTLLSLAFNLECIKFLLAVLLMTNLIVLFYSYFSVERLEQKLSFV
jgi:hypothetical protein